MQPICPKVLDRANLGAGRGAHGRDTRPNRFAISMDGAGTAKRDPAAKLRASQPQDVTQVPEQGHVGIAIENAIHSIYFELHNESFSRIQTAFRVPPYPARICTQDPAFVRVLQEARKDFSDP